MTLESIKSLSDQQLNLKVGELSGWRRYDEGWANERLGLSHQLHLPDFCNDLNAVHELELLLIKKGGIPTYEHNLRLNEIVGNDPWWGSTFATARQRCEALILIYKKPSESTVQGALEALEIWLRPLTDAMKLDQRLKDAQILRDGLVEDVCNLRTQLNALVCRASHAEGWIQGLATVLELSDGIKTASWGAIEKKIKDLLK